MKFAQSFSASLSLVLCSTLFGDVWSLVSILWGILWIDLNHYESFVCQINLTQRPLTFIISVHLHGIAWVMHSSSFWRPCIFFQQLIGVRCAGRQYIYIYIIYIYLYPTNRFWPYTAHDIIFSSAAWFHQPTCPRCLSSPDYFANLFRTCLNRVDIVWWAASSWYKLPDQALEEEVAVQSSFDGCDRRSLLDTGRCYQLLTVAIQYLHTPCFWSLSLLINLEFFWVSCCSLCFSELCICSLLARYS